MDTHLTRARITVSWTSSTGARGSTTFASNPKVYHYHGRNVCTGISNGLPLKPNSVLIAAGRELARLAALNNGREQFQIAVDEAFAAVAEKKVAQ